MNIMYVSVHAILEDDEVRLLKSLGHNVFCLGINNKNGIIQSFREKIDFNPGERALFDHFECHGGSFDIATPWKSIIPKETLDLIDVVIVMHDFEFIAAQWDVISSKPVVWRTIGQAMETADDYLRKYRKEGLHVVGYSAKEDLIHATIGRDEQIRFYKDERIYSNWEGSRDVIATFSNDYAGRYPELYGDYLKIVADTPAVLGGWKNEDAPQSIGLISPEEQIQTYRQAKGYLYASGPEIPYTLNFIEAWMTGVPTVIYMPERIRGTYFEIDELVEDGVTGFVCRDIRTAQERLSSIRRDKDLANRLSEAGRSAAIKLFGKDNISKKWSNFLDKIIYPRP